jgi:hypothetical protein
MDPVTIVVTALTLGIAAGLKPTAEQAVKDAYEGLKQLIERRYDVDLGGLEKKPESEAQGAAVEESLSDAGADNDEELLDQAKALIDLIKRKTPETAAAHGIDLNDIEAEYLKVKKILAEGQAKAVTMKKVRTTGGVEIEDVSARSEPSDPKA